MSKDDQPGLVVRQATPLNLEFQFSSLAGQLVEADQFFVRSHFPVPHLAGETWRLSVGGAVEKPLELSLRDILALPSVTRTAVVECAGNGRVYYQPAKEGLQWQNGAVGNAAWTGVLLRDVLARAGLKAGAVDVILIGADRGSVDEGKKTASPGRIAFARSLPLAKALSEDTLLAYAMNGETLTAEHGFPLRAVVGGWFGMAWVKWITGISVVERPFHGYWQTRDYFGWERDLGEPSLVPLTQMQVKSQIARPVDGASVTVGKAVRVFGAAWSGEAPVTAVDIHVGEGSDWRPAQLLGRVEQNGWRFFEYYWTPARAGRHEIRCRATDAAGHRQPETQQPDRESYVANWIVPTIVRAVTEPALQTIDFDI